MLSENPRELFALLASIGQNPRVNGCGYYSSKLDKKCLYGAILHTDVDDFCNTEALFKSSITPSRHQPFPPQD